MSINPVEACSTHAERPGNAHDQFDARARAAEQAYAAVLQQIDEAEWWQEFQQAVLEALAAQLANAYESFLNAPIEDFLLTPQNLLDLLGILDAAGAMTVAAPGGFLSVFDASGAYDNWQHQEDLLRDARVEQQQTAADYRNCIRRAALRASRCAASDD